MYIRFENERPSTSGLTKVWDVVSGGIIGSIKWYAPWRRYCFYPCDMSLYDASCLADIAAFLLARTTDHKHV